MSRSACSIWTWIVLLAYGFIVSGLPVPCGYLAPAATQSVLNERLAAKDRSSPFPCMDKTCGCLSSDQCFQHCCCHTPTELLMWAQSQQIELTIIKSLQARVETLRQTTEKEMPLCCEHTSNKSCCGQTSQEDDSESTMEDPEICSDYQSMAATCEVTSSVEQDNPQPASREGRVRQEPLSASVCILQSVMACEGLLFQWVSLATAQLPAAIKSVVVKTPIIERIRIIDDIVTLHKDSPETPPPRMI